MRLEELPGDKGARQKRHRIGRGESSGWGKTAGRGAKGAQSRSGYKSKTAFEGGQTALVRRVPKRGFSRKRFEIRRVALNLAQLGKFDDGATVNFDTLVQAGLISRRVEEIKILGEGEIQKKLNITAHGFSASAREKIEAAGGACQILTADSEPPQA
ncbi:50S ribosomal protein L15 [bacterium]|nr:50S ribosomal protein L15 [bacterium]